MNDTITISRARLDRIGEVLAYLTVRNFDPRALTIDLSCEDDFAVTEAMLNEFTREYSEAVQENERLNAERMETIERQRLAITDLSTPIIDIWDDIITLPIVGVVDSHRSLEMTERLLTRISETHTKCVIIDLTGVDVVDTMTADHLLKMIRSASLLGSYCVVSGISPSIAQTLVQLDVDLGKLRTVRNLKEALRDCFVQLQRHREREAGHGALESAR